MCDKTEQAESQRKSRFTEGSQVPGGGELECSRPMSEDERLNEIFSYRSPSHLTGPKFESIREAARHFAKVVSLNVPSGPDRYIAIQKIREAVMIANAGIALDGLSL